MSLLSNLGGFFGKIISFFAGKSQTAKLLDKLKNNPQDVQTLNELKELFNSRPVDFVIEILRRAKGTAKRKEESNRDIKNSFRQTWENSIHKERVQPLELITPSTREELVNFVQKAEARKLMVRAVGMGHSFSDVSNATDILISMTGLKKPLMKGPNNSLPAESDTYKPSQKPLFCCEAGMLVQQLNAELDKLDLAIPAMAAFDQETIYGAIATATHGTGLRIPGMPAMVRSLDLLAEGGKWYRIEPSNGITDKTLFDAKYPNKEIELLQNDDHFHSVVVGFGLMGIVYSIVIEPVKTFYLMQRLWVSTWDEIKIKLANRSFFEEIDDDGTLVAPPLPDGKIPPTRAQVFVNPYITKNFMTKKEGHTCVVQVQLEISKSHYEELKKNTDTTNAISKIVALFKLLESNGEKGVHEASITGEDKDSIVDEIGIDALLEIFNDFPVITPLMIDISMLALLSGSGKFGKSFIVMNQGKLAIKDAGYSVEPGFAVDPNNSFIKGAEEVFRVADVSKESYSFLTSPMCMRFVQGSPDYLSPEYATDTCMMDVPMMLGTIGDDQFYERLQIDTLAIGARPHWGKICSLVNGREMLEKMYPRFNEFLKSVEFFNPNGTFNSSFAYRTGILNMEYERTSGSS